MKTPELSQTSAPGTSANGRIVRNIAALGMGQMFTWASTFALVIVLPSTLGVESLGKLTTAISITDFCGLIAVLGVTNYMTKEFARKGSDADIVNALATRLPLILGACALSALLANLFRYDAETRNVIYLLCGNIAMMGVAAVLVGALQGMQEMRVYAIASAASKVSLIGFVTLFVLLGWGLIGVALAWVLQTLVLAVVCAVPLIRGGHIRGRVSPGGWRFLIAGSMPFFVWQASLMFYGQVDVVLLSLLTRDEVVGWYGAAYRIIAIPTFIPVIIVSAVFPALSRYAIDDRVRFLALARRSMQMVLLTTIPISLGMIVVAPRMLGVLHYPAEYDEAGLLIMILAIHVPFMGADMVLGAVLNATDRQRTWAFTGVAAAIFNPTINLALIPYFDQVHGNGAIGAASSTVFTELFMLTAAAFYLRGQIFDATTRSILARCLAAGAVMVLVVWLARSLPLPVAIIMGALTYASASIALGLVSLRDMRQLRGYLTERAATRAAATV